MRNLPVMVMMLFTSLMLAQETGTLRGTIHDEEVNNEPLMFASVSVQDTDIAAETNLHGNFEIDGIEPGSYTLVISYPGYEQRHVPVNVALDEVSYIQKGLRAKRISLAEVAGNELKPAGEDDASTAEKSAIRR